MLPPDQRGRLVESKLPFSQVTSVENQTGVRIKLWVATKKRKKMSEV